jgi:hypothetical protein
MDKGNEEIHYTFLGEIAERLFEECEEDERLLAVALEKLDEEIREELLVSDFLNAYQVFYYFFRVVPGELEKDRLILQPASALVEGVLIDDTGFLEVIFRIEDHRPVISISDGEDVLVNYRGNDAYQRAVRFIDENL